MSTSRHGVTDSFLAEQISARKRDEIPCNHSGGIEDTLRIVGVSKTGRCGPTGLREYRPAAAMF